MGVISIKGKIMQTKKLAILLVISLAMVFSSCSDRLTDFTVISTRNVPIGNAPTDLVKGNQRVQGVDKRHIVLSIPLGSPNLKEAIDKAIEKCPGAIALADGVVKSKFLYFFFYGQTSYIVEGTPLFPADYEQHNNVQNGIQRNSYIQNGMQYNSYQTNPVPYEKPVMRITHEVNMEKSVAELAKMYEVSVPNIMKWNNLNSPNLNKGQKIIIYLEEK